MDQLVLLLLLKMLSLETPEELTPEGPGILSTDGPEEPLFPFIEEDLLRRRLGPTTRRRPQTAFGTPVLGSFHQRLSRSV